ncbi:hypothetical protein BpHYR1_025681 [Brachionus plicatilis]|uniref:Uncharacterized protein n=1 Tax=Brachionus plicatilis TaxID=10195 RepID=A0A3M7SH07_BRAPC|nr:hypothetical protein BpHYR1_025681 [Brachionus plicatilis]
MIIGRGVHKKTKPSQPILPKQLTRIISNFDYEKSAIERPWENFTASYPDKYLILKIRFKYLMHIPDGQNEQRIELSATLGLRFAAARIN